MCVYIYIYICISHSTGVLRARRFRLSQPSLKVANIFMVFQLLPNENTPEVNELPHSDALCPGRHVRTHRMSCGFGRRSFRCQAIKEKPGIESDSLRGSSVTLRTVQIILAWPLRKDYMRKSRNVNKTNPIRFLFRRGEYPPHGGESLNFLTQD